MRNIVTYYKTEDWEKKVSFWKWYDTLDKAVLAITRAETDEVFDKLLYWDIEWVRERIDLILNI